MSSEATRSPWRSGTRLAGRSRPRRGGRWAGTTRAFVRPGLSPPSRSGSTTFPRASTGIAVAVAIALHNIPEGLAVAVPVFYSSGSRAKGILWGVLSGLSEPLGGLFGHLVLKGTDMNPLAYGTLFALVGGMMTYISFAELLPNALYHDPSGHSATASCLLGMAVMAASLLLFEA